MAKTALVTGATGLLGREVKKAFERADWNVTGTGLTRASPPSILKVDLSDEQEIVKALDEVKPDVLVHCAANRQPDSCSADPEGTRALNVTATSLLATHCASRSISLLYISTDYVFPGTPGDAPYAEDAVPAPTNFYGETKLDGEKEVLKVYKQNEGGDGKGKGVVLRVPVLYGTVENGNNGESAVNTLVDAVWKAQKEEVGMDHWAVRYPTCTEDVGRVCVDVAQKYLPSSTSHPLPSILQFSSQDPCTKYEICQRLSSLLAIPLGLMTPLTSPNDPQATVQRPYDCHLSTQKLQEIGVDVQCVDFTDWWRREMRAFRK